MSNNTLFSFEYKNEIYKGVILSDEWLTFHTTKHLILGNSSEHFSSSINYNLKEINNLNANQIKKYQHLLVRRSIK